MNRNWLAAVLLALAVLLAGCGGPDGGPGADNETEVVDDETPDEIVEDETPTEVIGEGTPTEAPSVTTGALPHAPDVGEPSAVVG